jgi:hypothetical protein
MKIIIILTLVCFIIVILLFIKGAKDNRKEDPADDTIPDEEMFMENDEFSLDNTISHDTIKRVSLQNKLRKIEEEKGNINIDYTNYHGNQM